MRVFVTGGSGFVGGHLIERLVRDGHEVFAMARSERSGAAVEALGARAVTASLGALEPKHLDRIDALIHCAAYVEEHGTRAQFFEANVEGTRNALDAAAKAGVKRFVHVGTEAALFDGRDLVRIDEAYPYPARHRFLYPETKAEAEKLVLAKNDTKGMTTVSIRPRFVWGPRDTSILPAVLEMADKGAYAWLDHGRHQTSSCHVANLVEALVLALDKGVGGRAYFVTDGVDRTLKETLSGLAATRGVTLPSRNVRSWIARPLSSVVESLWSITGARPPMSRFAIAMMSSSVTVDDSAARRDLGYRPVITIDEGLRAMRTNA